MELVNPRTGEYKGDALITDDPFEEQQSIVTPVTIHVSGYDRELFDVINRNRRELVEEFKAAYGRNELGDLLEILDDIERCAFTIVAYQHCPLISTSNLSAAADRLGGIITAELSSFIIKSEVKFSEKTHSLSMVPHRLVAYAGPIVRYVLYEISYELRRKNALVAD